MLRTATLSVALALLAYAPAASHAEERVYTRADVCAAQAKAARTLMKGRQVGVPVEKMIEPIYRIHDGADEQARMVELVLSAYSRPRYQTPQVQQREVDEFSTAAYLRCMAA